jgi:hypothetical protein
MNYQDLWFAFAGFFYTVAMIPAMRDPATRMPLRTSVPTALLLGGSALAYATMGMALSCLSCLLGSAAYLFLARYRSEL